LDPSGVRHILIDDWVEMENTPPSERHQARILQWCQNARELAELEGRQLEDVETELRTRAHEIAEHERQETMQELARDLAVAVALGQVITPPWWYRLSNLAQVMGESRETVQAKVESLAENVRVFVSA
jgi:RecB family exonuclease